MPLILLIVAVLILGLGLIQAWTVWFLKREIQRLEFRLNEALDDEDLLEFQERLKALLDQAKETAQSMAEGVDERRKSLEKALEKAKLAEKSLALRILAQSAASEASGKIFSPKTVKKMGKNPVKTGAKPTTGPRSQAPTLRAGTQAAKPAATSHETPASGSDALPPDPARESRSESESRRSYLARPQTAPARYQNIYDLADQGLSPEQISKNSGLLAGEVDLILNLRRKEPPKA